MQSNTASHAERELKILCNRATDPDNRPVIEEFIPEILALCEKFGLSGQSGGSAPYTAAALSQVIKKLCLQEPICPVTGIEEEWVDVSHLGGIDEKDVIWQNNRCSAVFKHSDGRPYYLDAIVWKGDTQGECGNDWDTFVGTVEGFTSRQFIKSFPFTPKTFYIDVTRKMLPEDWIEEPFYENQYYNTKEFEETGIKNWYTEKYKYVIKNRKQLKEVWKYYNQFN